jgi:hypothetical protein
MKTKYEVIQIDQVEITVDVSMFSKTGEMFFNATDMAKPFDKTPKDFLRIKPTKEYIEEIFKEDFNPINSYEELVRIRRGKYGGTWFHNELAFEFAGWCSAKFRRQLHKWAEQYMIKELEWQRKRLEAKTGFLPMTNAVQLAHDNPMHFHFSNEADLINIIVLGMRAREYKILHGVDRVRDAVSAAELEQIRHLQNMNTGLIEMGMNFQDRKNFLFENHNKRLALYEGIAA